MIVPGKSDRPLKARKREGWAALINRSRERIDPDAMGTRLYPPAYSTGLWRLSHEGFIPEGVTTPTFATPKETKTVFTKAGPFEYYHIPRHAFFGFRKQNGASIARPEKALLDFFWFQNVEWDRAEFERWRIQDDWKRLDWDLLGKFVRKWDEPRLKRAVRELEGYLR